MGDMLDKLGIRSKREESVKKLASKSNDAIIRKGHFSVYGSYRRTHRGRLI